MKVKLIYFFIVGLLMSTNGSGSVYQMNSGLSCKNLIYLTVLRFQLICWEMHLKELVMKDLSGIISIAISFLQSFQKEMLLKVMAILWDSTKLWVRFGLGNLKFEMTVVKSVLYMLLKRPPVMPLNIPLVLKIPLLLDLKTSKSTKVKDGQQKSNLFFSHS